MAKTPTQNLKARIIDYELDENDSSKMLVTVQFTDALGPWTQTIGLKAPDRPISMEEFIVALKNWPIERPLDPFLYLKESMDRDFELTIVAAPIAPVE